ncbi:unnamed protein product [Timema podura]|uniref:Serpin domain-containing protein n=1 Tax=Timema podura TaxID=61482 RepID=A0ABN7P178_TIMPD|nr:unnamed protein product [Timema podura]
MSKHRPARARALGLWRNKTLIHHGWIKVKKGEVREKWRFCVLSLVSHVLKHQEKGSFALSPVSIRASAAILTVGTKGRAVDDIRHVLRIPADTMRVKMKTLYFLDNHTITNATIARIGTALFPSEGLHINKQFQDVAEQYFKTEIIKLDYENKTDDAISMINGWIGHGVELYKRDSLPPSTMLVLVEHGDIQRVVPEGSSGIIPRAPVHRWSRGHHTSHCYQDECESAIPATKQT